MSEQEYVWRLHMEFITMVSLVCSHQRASVFDLIVIYLCFLGGKSSFDNKRGWWSLMWIFNMHENIFNNLY